MKKSADHGIDEVRAARMEVSSRYNHDVDRMLADHLKQQQRYGNRLIRVKPPQNSRKSSRRASKRAAALSS